LRVNGAYETAWQVYRKPLYAWVAQGGRPGLQALFRAEEGSESKVPSSRFQVAGSKPSDAPTSNLTPDTWNLQPATLNPPSVESRVFSEHGYVILRSIEGKEYWDSDSWAAFLSFDLNSVHSHADKMNLILFGRGKTLAPDPEAIASVQHAFSSQVQRELNRSTICHNTLMVDGRGHAGIGEKLSLIDFERSPDVKTATIADLKGLVYPGVKMQRTVIVTDGYVLDVFQAVSETEHTYDWLFHALDDEGKTRMYGGFQPTLLPDVAPWSWLRNPRSAVLDRSWHADWRQGDVRFRLTMLGVTGTEIIL
ncbi:MAG: heparinase II/III family protein, partial [Armatimonadetes bacterium]|nr:heparinase II/III family protein [Armatimonadota bacterium]